MRVLVAFSVLVFSWDPSPTKFNITTSSDTHVSSIFPSDGPVSIAGPKDVLYNRTVLVNYYSEYCPHCWLFAVTLNRVAAAIRGSKIEVVAVNCGDDQLRDTLCNDEKIYVYPTLQLYDADSTRHADSKQCHDKPCAWKGTHDSAKAIISWLQKHYRTDIVTHPEALEGESSLGGKIVGPLDPPGVDGWKGATEYATTYDRWSDALAAFTRVLKDQYTPQRYPEMKAVVDYVVASFPGNRASLDALAKHVSKKKYESRKELAEMLDKWSANWQISQSFSTCSNPTCAIWTLFHVCAATNAAHTTTPLEVGRGASPEETLGFLRTMVKNFFGCKKCIDHFEQMYNGAARHAVTTSKDAVIWLWEAHQRVNLRVAAEHAIDLDRRWPSYQMCPACWRPFLPGRKPAFRQLSLRSNTDETPWSELSKPFNISNVYMMLLQTYVGFENIAEVEETSL